MTELIITPKVQDKTARFKGAIAAGEHVAVTIKGGAEWIGEDDGANMVLRVIDLTTKRTLAVFPRPPETLAEGETFAEGENEWDSDESDLTCKLNLNTARMMNAARHMITVPVLFVLGDTDNPRTLYFRDQYEVEYWPERIGDDVPYDLDRWPKQIDDWTALVAEWQSQMTAFGTTLTGHVGNNNIHVTAEQKTTWSAKQSAIADLETIRAGAAKGATALQEHQDISNKADLVDGKVPTTQLPDVGGRFIVVAELPSAASADPKAIYLVPRTTSETGNIYDEYLRVEPTTGTYAWEKIGSTDIDLSNYLPKSDVIDPQTATQTGKAADAKATGNVLAGKLPTAEWIKTHPRYGVADTDTVAVYADGSRIVANVVCLPAADTPSSRPWDDQPFPLENLVAMYGGSNLGSLNPEALKGATSLEIVDFPAVMHVDNEALYGCTALKTASFAALAAIYGVDVFRGCSSLVDVNLPLLQTLQDSLFAVCTSLERVSLPAATFSNSTVFYNCTSLREVNFGNTSRSFDCPGIAMLGYGLPTTCVFVVPDGSYASWTADEKWQEIMTAGYRLVRYSDWRLAHLADVPDVSGFALKSEMSVTPGMGTNADKTTVQLKNGTAATVLTAHQELTPIFSTWKILRDGVDVTSQVSQPVFAADASFWDAGNSILTGETVGGGEIPGTSADLSLEWVGFTMSPYGEFTYTATRSVVGYTLGTQSTKPLQPKGDYAPATGIAKSALASDVQASLGKADTAVQPAALAGKLDSSSAAPAYDATDTYAVGDHVTYNGGLYVCSTAIATAEAWTPAHWTATDMTTPDATLDITSAGQLRVVDANSAELWSQGYNLASASSGILSCDQGNLLEFAATAATAFSDSAAYAIGDLVVYGGKVYKFTAAHAAGAWVGTDAEIAAQALTFPTSPSGKVGDFGLDVDNTANADVSMSASLTGLDSAFSVVVPEGENLADMLTFEPGELAELYFTMTAFRVNNLPTWSVAKRVVENGGAAS